MSVGDRCIVHTVDHDAVELIVNGAYTPAIQAIPKANLATLQLAAIRCEEAAHNAISAKLPFRQYKDRAVLCRSVIRHIESRQRESF